MDLAVIYIAILNFSHTSIQHQFDTKRFRKPEVLKDSHESFDKVYLLISKAKKYTQSYNSQNQNSKKNNDNPAVVISRMMCWHTYLALVPSKLWRAPIKELFFPKFSNF